MANKWMLGTALAAVMVATPALAQNAMSDFGECKFEEMTNETFLGLDLNDDTGLTMDEYRECLQEAGIELDDDGMSQFEAQYTSADADGDGMLMYAEVETYIASADTASSDAPEGTITVTQPAADVTVTQPAAEVTVTQQDPTVQVETPAPEVAVTTPEPQVAVQQAEPKVSVEQPEPTVTVDQKAPEVAVTQAEPQVAVEAGTPAVEVETQAPEVAVATPKPEVEVTQPDLKVEVEQENPQVAVRQEQADVAVVAETNTEAAVAAAVTETSKEVEAATEATMTETAATTETTTATAAHNAADAVTYEIRIDDLVGADLVNVNGEEIGEIDEIVLDPQTNKPVVLVSTGGFLGIGDREVAFPYDDLKVTGDQIMLSTDLTEEMLKEMPDVDESRYTELPETMIVR